MSKLSMRTVNRVALCLMMGFGREFLFWFYSLGPGVCTVVLWVILASIFTIYSE